MWEAVTKDDNYLVGFRTRLNIYNVDLLAEYTTVGGSIGGTRVWNKMRCYESANNQHLKPALLIYDVV